ncbi:hypothetical protein BKA64DRAFT_757595 [Cadophora sp. MPI-SDFR-AT-0126]|nr:hypothetical protein BKA64DRAFT_757595 [Leotiomycetes sp. MPI-SDFR-AT-0126]
MASSRRSRDARGILVDHIKKPYEHNAFPEEWRNLPEVPSSAEIKPVYKEPVIVEEEAEEWDAYQRDLLYDEKLPHNIIDGPWPSKEAYLGAHYQMIREDSIASLRNAVTEVQDNPSMEDTGETCIYTDVTFMGLQLSRRGIASRVEFSCERAGKRIRWEQSKRLLQGTIVALTPERDMFKTICKVATVAARVIKGGLDQDPPNIDLFWGDLKDIVIDPVEKYVMVESRQGFFESSRHTMVALQKLMTEQFSFAKELVELDSMPEPPLYVQQNPFMDLTSLERSAENIDDLALLHTSEPSALSNMDVLHNFPKNIKCDMDSSQMTAYRNMITKRLAIIRGPPGTGKTFVSVSALKAMIQTLGPDDPPILVAAQTNHALDQLLNHILEFENEIVRLGGQSDRGNVAIRERTFYELRQGKDLSKVSQGLAAAYKEHGGLCAEAVGILSPLLNDSVVTADTLLEHGIITKGQRQSLEAGDWAIEQGENELATEDLAAWLTDSQLMPIPSTPSVNLGFPLEDADIEYEQLQELALETAEAGGPDEKDPDFGLDGNWLGFGRKFTGRHNTPIIDSTMRRKLSRCKDLFEIPVAERGQMYRYFEKQVNSVMMQKMQEFLPKYQQYVENFSITKSMSNIKLMKQLGIKVVGCTTTGLSKYRGFLSAIEPRTLLIEEAAETLESKIIAGMMESLQQLILVGDHKQLQASCTVQALQDEPYYLSISMFERLIKNSMPFVMLNHQRRMIPDIRKLLCIPPDPFYKDLYDHEYVLDRVNNRPPVPGMDGLDTYFFSHNWTESRSFDGSCFNLSEADMIAEFFNYLVLNGVQASTITVLTFYNGQRKTIIKQLKKHPSLGDITYFNVFTVDSYQGEENDIILLSMVRSNQNLGVGFLDNKNRLVVALSRARRGLYLFGNSVTLTAGETTELGYGRDPLYDPLILFMRNQGRYDIDGGLPITCARHHSVTRIYDADGWAMLTGGCQRRCEGGVLPCGHACFLLCHPFDHSRVICREACTQTLPCGHGCSRNCGQSCVCDQCHVAETGLIFVPDNFEYWEPDPSISSTSSLSPTKSALKTGESQGSAHRQVKFIDDTNPYTISDVRYNLHLSNSRVQTNGQTIQPSSKASAIDRRAASDHTSGHSSTYGSDSARSTPVKSRVGRSTSSRNRPPPAFAGFKREALVDSTYPGFQNWANFNAKLADQEIDEKQRMEAAKAPKVDPSSIVIKETFRPVIIKNGVRIKDPSGPVRTLIQPRRSEIDISQSRRDSVSMSAPGASTDPSFTESPPKVQTDLLVKNELKSSQVKKKNAGTLRRKQGNAKEIKESPQLRISQPILDSPLDTTSNGSSVVEISNDPGVRTPTKNGGKDVGLTDVPNEAQDLLSDFDYSPRDAGCAPTSVYHSGQLAADPFGDFFGPLEIKEVAEVHPLSATERSSPWTSVNSHEGSVAAGHKVNPVKTVVPPVEQDSQLFDLLSISDDLGHQYAKNSVACFTDSESVSETPSYCTGGVGLAGDMHPHALTSVSKVDIKQGSQSSGLLHTSHALEKLDGILKSSISHTSEKSAQDNVVNLLDDRPNVEQAVGDDIDLLIDFRNDLQVRSSAPQKSLIDESDDVPSFSSPSHHSGLNDDEDLIAF